MKNLMLLSITTYIVIVVVAFFKYSWSERQARSFAKVPYIAVEDAPDCAKLLYRDSSGGVYMLSWGLKASWKAAPGYFKAVKVDEVISMAVDNQHAYFVVHVPFVEAPQ